MSETDIQRAILDALTAVGAIAWRCNSGIAKVRGGWMHLAPAGTPDVIVLVPPYGRYLGLEVKTAKGKERESQAERAVELRRVGGLVAIARTPEEAVRAYLAAKDGTHP